MSKKLEDLTLEEIKAQMSIYQTLYYKRRKQEDPEYAAKIRERDRQRYHKKRDELGKPSMKDVRKYNHLGLIAVSAEWLILRYININYFHWFLKLSFNFLNKTSL